MSQQPNNGVPPGFYSFNLQVHIPIGTEIAGDPLIGIPLSNGQIQVTIPHGSIPRGLSMLASIISTYANLQQSRDKAMAEKEKESRIVVPRGTRLPPFTHN